MKLACVGFELIEASLMDMTRVGGLRAALADL
jgi:hypothetical protein